MTQGFTRKLMMACAVAAVLLAGCSRSPPTVKPYEKDGVAFSHLSNWKIAEDTPLNDIPGTRSIVVEGPDDAIAVLLFLPPQADQSLESFAADVAEGRKSVVDRTLSVGPVSAGSVGQTRTQPITAQVGGREVAGLSQRFNVKVLGIDVPHEAKFFVMDTARHKVYVTLQVADEKAAQLQPAFETLLGSLHMTDRPASAPR